MRALLQHLRIASPTTNRPVPPKTDPDNRRTWLNTNRSASRNRPWLSSASLPCLSSKRFPGSPNRPMPVPKMPPVPDCCALLLPRPGALAPPPNSQSAALPPTLLLPLAPSNAASGTVSGGGSSAPSCGCHQGAAAAAGGCWFWCAACVGSSIPPRALPAATVNDSNAFSRSMRRSASNTFSFPYTMYLIVLVFFWGGGPVGGLGWVVRGVVRWATIITAQAVCAAQRTTQTNKHSAAAAAYSSLQSRNPQPGSNPPQCFLQPGAVIGQQALGNVGVRLIHKGEIWVTHL